MLDKKELKNISKAFYLACKKGNAEIVLEFIQSAKIKKISFTAKELSEIPDNIKEILTNNEFI